MYADNFIALFYQCVREILTQLTFPPATLLAVNKLWCSFGEPLDEAVGIGNNAGCR